MALPGQSLGIIPGQSPCITYAGSRAATRNYLCRFQGSHQELPMQVPGQSPGITYGGYRAVSGHYLCRLQGSLWALLMQVTGQSLGITSAGYRAVSGQPHTTYRHMATLKRESNTDTAHTVPRTKSAQEQQLTATSFVSPCSRYSCRIGVTVVTSSASVNSGVIFSTTYSPWRTKLQFRDQVKNKD